MKRRLLLAALTFFGMFGILGSSYCLHKFVLHSSFVNEIDAILKYFEILPFQATFTNISAMTLALLFIFGLFYLVVFSGWEKKLTK